MQLKQKDKQVTNNGTVVICLCARRSPSVGRRRRSQEQGWHEDNNTNINSTYNKRKKKNVKLNKLSLNPSRLGHPMTYVGRDGDYRY